jgi:hypothetical protein
MKIEDLIIFLKGFIIGCLFLTILTGFCVIILVSPLEVKALFFVVVVGSYGGYVYYDIHKEQIKTDKK